MAKKSVVHLTDDLDGSDAVDSVHFGYEGRQYVIDLNEDHAAEFRAVLERHVAVAQFQPTRVTVLPPKRKDRLYDPSQVRRWAQKKGYAIGERGRISRDILEEYLNS